MPDFAFDRLRRWPDVEAPNLFAVDATDRLLLDEAAAPVRDDPDAVVVIDDRYGALTLGSVALLGATGVRVHQDALVGELALAANADATGLSGQFANHALEATLVRGAQVILMQLPKSLAALQEIAETIAVHASPDVVVLAGGRVKHMTPAMNDVLRFCFHEVHATLARQKSRVLVARGPKPGVAITFPRRERHDDLDLWVCAHGETFSGTKIDFGTRFLHGFVERMKPDATTALDLGCGTGVLAALLARARPRISITATDDSAAAVASAKATLRANDLADRVEIVRDDAMSTVADQSVDLIVCNPPFHIGTTIHSGAASKLFAAAARVLRPGGELWTVYNTPLAHRSELVRLIGPTDVAGRNQKFTVTVSRAR